MKKIVNKLILIIIAVILLFTLTACSNNEDDLKESEVIEGIVKEETNKTEGKLSDIITSKNYGESVKYSANNVDEWKVFYNDGENVFIIASRNIPQTYVPTNIGLTTFSKYMGSFEVHWDEDDFVYAGISAIDKDIIDKYMFSWAKEYSTSENYSAKSAASLMDTSAWNNFVDVNFADSAIGTPTLDMFVASWNQVEKDKQIYINGTNEYGYFVDKEKGTDVFDCDLYNKPEVEEGKSNNFYLMNKDKDYGYWLIGPSAKDQEWMLAINKYGIDFEDTWVGGNGLRPVVCLKANTNGKLVDDMWILEK